jgi:hypothetical protein
MSFLNPAIDAPIIFGAAVMVSLMRVSHWQRICRQFNSAGGTISLIE